MPVVDDEVPTNVPSERRPAATAVQAESEESSETEDSEMHDGGAVDIAPVLPSKRRRRNDKFFGLSTDARTPPTGATRILDPLDYEAKYAPDPINEETAPNARVWRMCADEFAIFDADLSEDNRDTVDVLLVFAGLFSAVVTSFLVLVSAQLQPDYTQLSSSIMYELLVVQRAIGNASSVDLAPVSPSPAIPFVPSQSYIWVNGLWYTSLSLSLITALVASLVKQWMHQYMATTSGTPATVA
ncbi:hypothetical protein BDZ89DRAFT_1233034 [Hymenopellis radicata]|nr:hypothetical protein BDZ89DRAFT_1233034 [Hymenopellis radicata]